MLWTKNDVQIHGSMTAAGTPIIRRDANTAIVHLTVEEALGLIHEITHNLGLEGVPTEASFKEIELVIENPDGFYPKEF